MSEQEEFVAAKAPLAMDWKSFTLVPCMHLFPLKYLFHLFSISSMFFFFSPPNLAPDLSFGLHSGREKSETCSLYDSTKPPSAASVSLNHHHSPAQFKNKQMGFVASEKRI